MRPRPKIHSFPLPSAAALLLCLAALIFSLCYEDPNYAQTDDFASTYWWGGAFGMLAIIECSIDLFVSPTDQKRDIDGFLTSALEFALLIIVLQSYFSHYADTEGTYRAPRYAAMIALILIAVLSATYKVLDFTHPDFFKDPLHGDEATLLLTGLGQILFAAYQWSNSVTHSALYGADGIAMIVSLILGLGSFLYALYLFSSKKALGEEEMVRNGLYVVAAGLLASLVTLFIAVGLWNENLIAYQVFYWDVFSMVGYLLSCSGGGGYLFYVYYRLRN
jgi:hypothetical protein